MIKTIEIYEPELDSEDLHDDDDYLHAFTAYSANGTVTSVYFIIYQGSL